MKYMSAVIYSLLLSFGCCNLTLAQETVAEQLVGIWKLEVSGFITDGEEVIKDFNACRLSQNFVFKSDGTVDYTYYEGDLDTCYVAAVETYNWELKQDTLVLESRGYWGYYRLTMEKAGGLRLEGIQEQRESTGDAMLDKLLSTVHFDVYRRRSAPVSCENCKVVLELK